MHEYLPLLFQFIFALKLNKINLLKQKKIRKKFTYIKVDSNRSLFVVQFFYYSGQLCLFTKKQKIKLIACKPELLSEAYRLCLFFQITKNHKMFSVVKATIKCDMLFFTFGICYLRFY